MSKHCICTLCVWFIKSVDFMTREWGGGEEKKKPEEGMV
jgi:hypothetical protein